VLIASRVASAIDEAWELLNDAAEWWPLFDNDLWRIEVARARLLHPMCDEAAAARHAAAALLVEERGEPRFPRHPGFDLLGPDEGTVREMERLAEG
jgi:hypothetical protein